MQAVLDDCYIMLYDGRISTAADLLNVLTKANSENKALLIVADDIGDEALATLIVNKMRGIVKVCAVKAPDFGERKTLLLEDMAILTGGQVISKDKGYKLDKLTPVQLASFLGTARTVTVSKDDTTIIDGAGTEEAITLRAQEIKTQIDKATSHYEKEKLQERLGKLVGGVAIISVGGNSDIEIKERKDRVEDALYATKAALLEGVVPGGGIALIDALNGLSIKPKEMSTDEMIGYDIVRKACFAPFKKILTNCGIEDYYTILNQLAQVKDGKDSFTYDAKAGIIVEAEKAGLLDPAKVTRTAIENAASVAGTILTTESVIFEKKDDKKADQGTDMMQGF
jgi:chaperonin GroEL